MTTLYVATINVPGYLPMDDDPPTFESIAEAWAYLAEQRERAEDEAGDYAQLVGGGDAYSDTRDVMADMGSGAETPKLGAVYGPTPGYRGDHDQGMAYSVSIAEETENNA